MRRNRTTEQLKAEILERAVEGALKTHIIRDCRLSFAEAQNLLGTLLSEGFVQISKPKITDKDYAGNRLGKKSKTKFLTTERGKLWLKKWKEFEEI